jgi:hypothetical protein
MDEVATEIDTRDARHGRPAPRAAGGEVDERHVGGQLLWGQCGQHRHKDQPVTPTFSPPSITHLTRDNSREHNRHRAATELLEAARMTSGASATNSLAYRRKSPSPVPQPMSRRRLLVGHHSTYEQDSACRGPWINSGTSVECEPHGPRSRCPGRPGVRIERSSEVRWFSYYV